MSCPDGLTPDGDTCPRCDGKRAPSGIDGGTWVHVHRERDPESASLALSTLRREVLALIAENRRMREALERIQKQDGDNPTWMRDLIETALETKE